MYVFVSGNANFLKIFFPAPEKVHQTSILTRVIGLRKIHVLGLRVNRGQKESSRLEVSLSFVYFTQYASECVFILALKSLKSNSLTIEHC